MNSIEAKVRYLKSEWKGRNERPRIGSRETRRANTELYDVEIRDGRALHEAGGLVLEPNGFALVEHQSAVRNFRDNSEVCEVFYREWEAKLLDLSGAEQVWFLHHLIRTETPRDFNDAYSRYVHCDFSDQMGTSLAHGMIVKHTGDSEAEAARRSYALYNIWQPIERDVEQNPLTLIDASSLAREDVVEYEYTAYEEVGVASMPVYDPAHRFYYFPKMTPREAIVFKQLDLREDRSYCAPHTSFDDPSASDTALGRRSIELRAVAVFPEDA